MTNPKSKTKRSLSAGEAGVLFVLLLGLVVTIGVAVSPHGDDDQTVAIATEQPAVAPAAPEAVVAAETADRPTGETAGTDDDPVTGEAPAAAEDPLASWATAATLDIYRAAERAYHDGDYGQAADLLVLYTERRPENAWGHYLLGLAQRKVGALDDAETSLRRALELAPDHLKSRVNLARVLLDRGDAEAAAAEAQRAVALDSTDVAAHRVAGLALAAAGRTGDAEREYRLALRLDPDDAWSLNDLGLLLIRQERFAEALPVLARAVLVNDRVAVFHNNLGVALERTGHPAAAAQAYAAAAALAGDDPRPVASRERCLALAQAGGETEEPVDLAALAAMFGVAQDEPVAVFPAPAGTTAGGTADEAIVARLDDEQR